MVYKPVRKIKFIDRVRTAIKTTEDQFDWFSKHPQKRRDCNKFLFEMFPGTSKRDIRARKSFILKEIAAGDLEKAPNRCPVCFSKL